jgi:hypothetical protein
MERVLSRGPDDLPADVQVPDARGLAGTTVAVVSSLPEGENSILQGICSYF